MRRYDEFQKQISKHLDDVPKCTVHTNEILLRLIATELAVIVDGIGRLANINYAVSIEDDPEESEKKDESGITWQSDVESQRAQEKITTVQQGQSGIITLVRSQHHKSEPSVLYGYID